MTLLWTVTLPQSSGQFLCLTLLTPKTSYLYNIQVIIDKSPIEEHYNVTQAERLFVASYVHGLNISDKWTAYYGPTHQIKICNLQNSENS